eukprot:g1128.t1
MESSLTSCSLLFLLIVSTSATAGGLDITFGVDGADYALSFDGRPWLQSGDLRFFANGEWHAMQATPPTPAPTPAVCTPGQPNADVGELESMICTFGNATSASCCAACQQEQQCNAWVLSTKDDGVVGPGACFLISGAVGYKSSTTRTAQVLGPPPAPPTPAVTGTIRPTRNATAPEAGSDRFGDFERWSFGWLATSAAGAQTAFGTAVRRYSDGATVVFEQSVPGGATRTNYKNVTFEDGKDGQRATTEPLPFLHFPSFARAGSPVFAEPGRAGFVTWQGTMVRMPPPRAGAPAASSLGLSSGPVVVFEGMEHGGRGDALVVSPATHFKGATMLQWADDWVVGLSGEITEVPAGFSHETIVHAGRGARGGVTAAVAGFGAMMQAAHGTRKRRDPVVEKVGYWTDNGAYYYGDAYPQHHDVIGDTNPDYNLTCCSKDKLLAAKRALDADALPMAYVQLDDWWYHGPHPVRNFSGGVKCVRRWELPSDTYPGGLTDLRSKYRAPFLLYGPYFCADNQWNQTLWPVGADAGVPPPAEAEGFYTRLFEYGRAHGGVGYEVDFMSNLFLDVPEFRRTLDASTQWQRGMNAAALATNTTVQFCMMQPSDLLNTLAFDAVTNGRASGDYCCADNWDVGGPSLLFWALGMRPSKDNFWSGDGQKRQPGFTETNPGTNGELNAILATMSTGPVGPADGAGQHNATRLRRTCAADGTILMPDRPLVPIDATYRQAVSSDERQLRSAAVWSTRSSSSSSSRASPPLTTASTGGARMQYHVLAVDVQVDKQTGLGAAVFASDLLVGGLGGDQGGAPLPARFAVRDWHRAAPCARGADAVASGCVRVSRGHDGDALVTLDAGMSWPFGTHTTQLYTVTPLEPEQRTGAITLLGELDKFVPLSSKRFSAVIADTGAGTLRAALAGLAGEAVRVTGLKQREDGTLLVVAANVTIGADGTGQLLLQ